MIDLQRVNGQIDVRSSGTSRASGRSSASPASAASGVGELPAIALYYPNTRTVIPTRMHKVLTDAQGRYDFSSYAWVAGPQ